MMGRGSYLTRLRRFPRWKLRLLPEALLSLLVARLALLAVPFPRIGKRIGTLQPPGPVDVPANEARMLEAQRIGATVETVADYFPLALVCLPRALAAWAMLQRRGIPSRLHFGAVREPKKPGLETHAWLTSGNAEVTGFPAAYGCVEVGFYSHRVSAGGENTGTEAARG